MSREYVLNSFRAPVESQIDYRAELNDQQYAAVTAPPGPCLVIAGAGSGKTRALTYRVAYLLEQGIPPERILLLTFTNKAAKEMMRRVADLLGHEMASLWGGTFHSIGNRILRQHAERIGYRRDFTILDRDDAKHLIAACVAELDIKPGATRFPKPDLLGEIFSLAVNTGKPVAAIVNEQHPSFLPLIAPITRLQLSYTARKQAANSMDFDDLLVLWLKLLQTDAELREHYQRRFQFILVDEFQDTNKLQSDLIDLLAARHHNLMVVGDDAQSIYAWRGANFQNILKFPERYPEAKTYKIETNYRSTPEILEVANAAITANVHQFTKQLAPARKPGTKPALVVCEDAGQQAAFVAQRALELREEGVELNKMAVLYRSHFHALELQLELVARNIPFVITSGIRFFEQAHIKDVTAHLKLVANPRDEISFKRLVKLMPGIGDRAAEKLWNSFAEEAGGPVPAQRVDTESAPPGGGGEKNAERSRTTAKRHPLTPALSPRERGNLSPSLETSSHNPLAQRLQSIAESVPKKAAVAWAQFVATTSQLEEPSLRTNPARMISLVLEAGYEDYLEENYDNHRSRLDDLEQLAVFARQFSDLDECLSQLALLTNVEAEHERPAANDTDQLRLSTIHQAKGLEFDVVFVIMLCEGLFPSIRSLETPEGVEEERRLMYVAITRARNELYLSYPLMRAAHGASDMMQQESRFLQEIPGELIEDWNLRTYA